jgi:hypothetical protein
MLVQKKAIQLFFKAYKKEGNQKYFEIEIK